MKRVVVNRLIYLVLICIGVFLAIKDMYYIIAIPVIAWLLVERVYWKTFYDGKKMLYKKQFKSAADKFETFLKELEDKPWLNNLKMFNIGIYTHNLQAQCYNNIGICYLESKSYKKATNYFNKAIELDDLFCIPYYNIAIIKLIHDNEEEARGYLLQSIKRGYNKVKLEQLKGYVMMKYKM